MPVKLSDYLKKEYGEKVYRLSLSSGCSCPNRDGKVGFGGCTFCSEGGSGEFAAGTNGKSLQEVRTDDDALKQMIDSQIQEAKEKIQLKTDARKFIAYFQSFTNTYGDVDFLRRLYTYAIERDEIVALSIGTRPDCLEPEIIAMLKELNTIKPVWIELGLQTIHEVTAKRINRGYPLDVFTDAYRRLKEAGITVIVHVILGLPGETKEMMLETVRFLAELSPALDGIKLQNLQILKGTVMYQQYMDFVDSDFPEFHIMSMEEYTDLVAECIALLPKETVVHRMQGDGPRKLLVEPLWSLDKKRVLNMLTAKTKNLWENTSV